MNALLEVVAAALDNRAAILFGHEGVDGPLDKGQTIVWPAVTPNAEIDHELSVAGNASGKVQPFQQVTLLPRSMPCPPSRISR